MDYDDLLDEAMSAFEEPEDGIAGLSVAKVDRYGWALRSVDGKRKALRESYDERRTTLDDVYARQKKTLDTQYTHLESLLKQWLLAWNAADPTKKSHELPCGVKVRSTIGTLSIAMTDEAGEAFAAWVAETRPDLMKPGVMKAGEVKKWLVDLNALKVDDKGKKLVGGAVPKIEGGVMVDDHGTKVLGAKLVKGETTVTVTP